MTAILSLEIQNTASAFSEKNAQKKCSEKMAAISSLKNTK